MLQCHKITSEHVKEVHELKSSQEEADTRLLLLAAHAGRDGYEAAVIVSEDTDVFVLCLAFQTRITCPLYQKCGTQTRTKYVDIAKVVQAHGEEFCKALPGVHAFTGCDSVSAFAGRGKVSALQLVRHDKAFQETFQQLGESCPLSEELFLKLQKFACQLYSSTSRTESVNALRYMLFCAKKGELESNQLPPCADCLRKHSQCANYQARVWRESLAQFPEVPTPVGSGWCLDVEDPGGENLTVYWMDGDPAPKAVLQLLSCKCTRCCKLPNCSCLQNGLKCTDMCRLKDCNNRLNEDSELGEVIEDDIDDDDDQDD